MTLSSRLPKFSGRVEYLACREEIEALMVKGYAIKTVYTSLKSSGKITMSYSNFCDYVRGNGKRLRTKKSLPKTLQVKPQAFARNQVPKEDPSSFVHDPTSDLHNAFYGE